MGDALLTEARAFQLLLLVVVVNFFCFSNPAWTVETQPTAQSQGQKKEQSKTQSLSSSKQSDNTVGEKSESRQIPGSAPISPRPENPGTSAIGGHAHGQNSDRMLMCRNRSEVRTLRTKLENDRASCRTIYSKAGIETVIAQGQYLVSCIRVFSNVRKNLEAAGWHCRDINRFEVHPITGGESGSLAADVHDTT